MLMQVLAAALLVLGSVMIFRALLALEEPEVRPTRRSVAGWVPPSSPPRRPARSGAARKPDLPRAA